MESFEFTKWCEEYELEEETVQALVDKGYRSYKSLRLLTKADTIKHFKTLLPAQLSLLQEGIALLQPDVEAPTAATSAPNSSHASDPNSPSTPASTSDPNPPPMPTATLSEPHQTRGINVQELLQMCGLSGPETAPLMIPGEQGRCTDRSLRLRHGTLW
jgi:hypothetical protein